jgi:hypothetical protein
LLTCPPEDSAGMVTLLMGIGGRGPNLSPAEKLPVFVPGMFTAAEWPALTAGVRDGEFDR